MPSALNIPQTQMLQSSIVSMPDLVSLFFFDLFSLLSPYVTIIHRPEVEVNMLGEEH